MDELGQGENPASLGYDEYVAYGLWGDDDVLGFKQTSANVSNSFEIGPDYRGDKRVNQVSQKSNEYSRISIFLKKKMDESIKAQKEYEKNTRNY